MMARRMSHCFDAATVGAVRYMTVRLFGRVHRDGLVAMTVMCHATRKARMAPSG